MPDHVSSLALKSSMKAGQIGQKLLVLVRLDCWNPEASANCSTPTSHFLGRMDVLSFSSVAAPCCRIHCFCIAAILKACAVPRSADGPWKEASDLFLCPAFLFLRRMLEAWSFQVASKSVRAQRNRIRLS